MNVYKVEKYGTLERIADLRKEKGISQKTLAEASGITERSISRWKDGATIRRSNLERIAEVLDCDVEFLECKQETPRKKDLGRNLIKLSPVNRYLPQIRDLMKTTTQKFEYCLEAVSDTKIVTGSYIEGNTKYHYEDIDPEYTGEIFYKISINGADPIRKSESEIEDFVKGIMKFISFQIEELK